jgi:crotonobetainyl-CoA:carnitine CoA-transferase CaiB-like acyl-CoA transferase
MNIGAATQDMWLKLCDAIGRVDLKTDPRFIDNAHRVSAREQLRELIEVDLARASREQWTAVFTEAQIPAGPINTIEDALNDAQVAHLGLIETVPHPALGPTRLVSNPLKLDHGGEGWIKRSPPVAGQHSREILHEFGLSDADISALEAKGIVVQWQATDAGASAAS